MASAGGAGRLAGRPYTPRPLLHVLSTSARDVTPVRQGPKEHRVPKADSISPKMA